MEIDLLREILKELSNIKKILEEVYSYPKKTS